MAEPGALSEAVRPVKADGSPDTEVLARLVVRHDDSAENVANRLALWDRQASGMCRWCTIRPPCQWPAITSCERNQGHLHA